MPNLTDRIKTALLRVAHALQAPSVANLKDQNAQLRDDLVGERMLCDLHILRCRQLTQQLDDLKQQLARHKAGNPQSDQQQETHRD